MQAGDKAEKLIKANFAILSTLIWLYAFSSTSYLLNLFSTSRVEKTREQHKHACGTPRDLPRNTQAQKQHIISPFIVGGKKGLTIDNTKGYDRNKAKWYKAEVSGTNTNNI